MKNFFAIFNLPTQFSLDLNLLEQKYFAFQTQFHPDLAGVAEIEQSILVNEAYEVLRNPLQRATHILQLNGVDINVDGGALRPNLATLGEVLEIQESIAELDTDGIALLKKNLTTRIKLLIDDAATKLDNQDFAAAAQILIKAKYFDKILLDLKK